MIEVVTDYIEVLKGMAGAEVRFVVIGQVAATLRGSAYNTKDLDICYERGPDNIRRLVGYLRGVHATLRMAGVDEGRDQPFRLNEEAIRAGGNFTFVTDHGDFDCLAWPSGVEGYEDLASRADKYDLDGCEVLAASLDDLLLMRRKAGRPKDVERIYELEEIKRIQESGELG